MTSIGVVAASAGGVETLRTGLVEPLVDEGHQVAVTLTPTAAEWLDHLGEVAAGSADRPYGAIHSQAAS